MLVLLSGVSGAGKDTIKKELIKKNKKRRITYHHIQIKKYREGDDIQV